MDPLKRFPGWLVVALALAVAACGGDGDEGDTLTEQQATQAFGSMQGALTDVGSKLETQGTTGSVNVTATCAGGGSATATGSWVSEESFSLDMDFNRCVSENITIDGNLSYDGNATSTGATVSIDGTVTFSGAVNGTCRIAVDISISSTSFAISGRMCGVDVSATLQN